MYIHNNIHNMFMDLRSVITSHKEKTLCLIVMTLVYMNTTPYFVFNLLNLFKKKASKRIR